MLIILIVFSLMTMSFTVFSIGIKLDAINRIIVQTPKGLVETCVPTYYEDDEVKPAFDKSKIMHTLTNYYENKLAKYVIEVEINYYFYNVQDGSYCRSKFCDGVRVELISYLVLNLEHYRTISFEIREGNVYGN